MDGLDGPHPFSKKDEPMNNAPVIHLGSRTSPALPRGRLMFGIDATASRQETWAIACKAQAEMFRETAPIGKLSVQLAFYRGTECCFTKWCESGEQLAHLMNKIDCRGGNTQIGRLLSYALRENERAPVQALIFVGDAMEESLDELAGLAGELGRAGVPIFMFQEGRDAAVRAAFRLLALRSGGAFFEFDPAKPGARAQLSEKLNAVAHLALGNAEALAALTDRRG